MLEQGITDYLLWMISAGYAQSTWNRTEQALKYFSAFINKRNISCGDIFNLDTLDAFRKEKGLTYTLCAVRGLWRYLLAQGRISQPLKEKPKLPDVYEKYLLYYARLKEVQHYQILRIRRVLSALNSYLERHKILLSVLRVENLDAFLAEYNAPFTTETIQKHRSCLRGFLRYLYQQCGILQRDIAPLLVGAPLFAQAKPPRFLRSHEVQRLFASLKPASAWDIRLYAMLHIIFTLGLRPKEISLITLDDILFTNREIKLRDRKNTKPLILPLSEDTIKAIAVYVIGVRPKNNERTLFLTLHAPYKPVSASVVSKDIGNCMRKAKLPSSAYWLRHTYAQNLLEKGTSIFEIKEMLGHDRIQTTRRYIHIHTKLMREVLFDETI